MIIYFNFHFGCSFCDLAQIFCQNVLHSQPLLWFHLGCDEVSQFHRVRFCLKKFHSIVSLIVIWVPYILIWSTLMIHGCCICEFAYSVKFICNLGINACGTLIVICGHSHAQSRKKFRFLMMCKFSAEIDKAALCLFVSALILEKSVLFMVYLMPHCFTFCFFLVGDFSVYNGAQV